MASAAAGDGEAAKLIKMARCPRTEVTRSYPPEMLLLRRSSHTGEMPGEVKGRAEAYHREKKGGGMLATIRVDKPAGAGLWVCDDTDATVSGSGERWISDSGATENMTPGPTGFERYETAPPGRKVEMGDGTLLPVAGYGDPRLKIKQDDADGGQTRDLVLRRAAHVPGLRHNLLSVA